MLEVIVALMGDPRPPEGTIPFSEADLRMPYAERRKVALTVRPDELLGEVLERAGSEWNAEQSPGYVAFYTPDDEAGFATALSPWVTLVDADGQASWQHEFRDVPYARLIEASDAGVLGGDPLRPYFVTQPEIGNGVLPDWSTIKVVWDALYYVLEHIDTIGGAIVAGVAAKRGVIDRLRRRSKSAWEVIERRSGGWGERNGDPQALDWWLDDRAWLPSELADPLGCSVAEAEALLWAFGFAESDSGLWRRDLTEESRFLHETNVLGWLSIEAPEEALREVVAEEVRAFLESGEARRIEWDNLPWRP